MKKRSNKYFKQKKDNYPSFEEELKYFSSQEFRIGFAEQVEKDTWGNGLPKIYMDSDGWLVHHYKDGRIDKIKKLQ
jgi:hypothetical protein